ncbi:MAG: response regulator transcription factor [Candidatus Nanopelagicales bacterium]
MSVETRGLVLVAEDERPIADLLGIYLRREGFGVHVAANGMDALAAARRLHPVAILLDVGLPGMDGTEVCRTLRAQGSNVPILFCTARDDEIDRVLGLEMGGDDYITKPFSPREVVARVKAVLRRGAPAQDDDARSLVLGDVELNRARHRVAVAGEPVELTATEFDLLAYLMERPGRVVTRDQLLSAVWGYSAAAGTRTVDVHVAQVRAKLGAASPIRTVRGVGYSAEAP